MVLEWVAFRTCTATPSLMFLGNMPCKYILSDVVIQESDLFWIESVFLIISFFFCLRIQILSVFQKLWQKSFLIQEMLMLSISEWSDSWQIHKPLVDRPLMFAPLWMTLGSTVISSLIAPSFSFSSCMNG